MKKKPKIQKIHKEFKKGGFEYKLLKRKNDVALYEQISKGIIYGYEVHIVRIAKACEAFGQKYPRREVLAGNEEFGSYGWSYIKKEIALDNFNKIVKKCQIQ